jgi:hypothetical protein
MIYGAEQKRFLTQNWEILDLHYLKSKSIKQIAIKTGNRESYVRRVVAEAWEMEITYGDIHDYMQRI